MRFILLLALSGLFAVPASAQIEEEYAALHAQDVRLAQIAERIMAANVDLCSNTMPMTGMILHSADQYTDPLPQWFANGNVAVSSVLPGSVADQAGIQANDAITSAYGAALLDLAIVAGEPRRDTIFNWLASPPMEGALPLSISRNGEEQSLLLQAPTGCRALVEILADNGNKARSDGRVVQISYGMAARLSDAHLAVVFAHELAHSVLHHRARLEEAGVPSGFFGELGSNRRRNRQVEMEADRLSVHLLANASYDPASVADFWRSDASRHAGGGLFRSGAYPSRRQRVELAEEEIAQHLQNDNGFSWPVHLLELRDQPFDHDEQD